MHIHIVMTALYDWLPYCNIIIEERKKRFFLLSIQPVFFFRKKMCLSFMFGHDVAIYVSKKCIEIVNFGNEVRLSRLQASLQILTQTLEHSRIFNTKISE